jgi:hypothetical protein
MSKTQKKLLQTGLPKVNSKFGFLGLVPAEWFDDELTSDILS